MAAEGISSEIVSGTISSGISSEAGRPTDLAALRCQGSPGDAAALEDLRLRLWPLLLYKVGGMRTRGSYLAAADVLQEAWILVQGSIPRWDPGRASFATFVLKRIRHKLGRQIRRASGPICVPTHADAIARRALNGGGIDDTPETLRMAALAGLASRPAVSAERFADAIADRREAVEGREDVRLGCFADRLGRLRACSPRLHEIIRLRYGLGGGDRMRQSEVGGVLGISQGQVRRLESLGLAMLRSGKIESGPKPQRRLNRARVARGSAGEAGIYPNMIRQEVA